MIVHIAPEFGYALITAVLVGFECVLIGFFFPGRLRSKVFNKKYLEENYSKTSIHRRGRCSWRLPRHGKWTILDQAKR